MRRVRPVSNCESGIVNLFLSFPAFYFFSYLWLRLRYSRLGKLQIKFVLLSAYAYLCKVMTPKFRIGHGYDVHALGEGLPLWLGGVRIEHTKGCIAHSDGDVAIHAVCDALLGAAALGDIGKLFPDTAPEFKGIDSKILLRRVVERLEEKGYAVGNVDCTIAMQRPKLRPRIDEMRRALAEAMGISVDCVSVKATTTERLGFEGREEGVSAHAVALIYEN